MRIDKPFDIIKFVEVDCKCCESYRIERGISMPQNKMDTIKIRYLCMECDITYFMCYYRGSWKPVNNKKYLWENQLKE